MLRLLGSTLQRDRFLGHKAKKAACAVRYYHPEFGWIRSPVPNWKSFTGADCLREKFFCEDLQNHDGFNTILGITNLKR